MIVKSHEGFGLKLSFNDTERTVAVSRLEGGDSLLIPGPVSLGDLFYAHFDHSFPMSEPQRQWLYGFKEEINKFFDDPRVALMHMSGKVVRLVYHGRNGEATRIGKLLYDAREDYCYIDALGACLAAELLTLDAVNFDSIWPPYTI